MDIFSKIFDTYAAFAYCLPVSVFSFLLRANVLLLLPVGIAYLGFTRGGWRSRKLQHLMIVVGLLIGLSLPLDRLVHPSGFRPMMVIVLITGLIYLPAALAFFCEPRWERQYRLRKRIHIGLAILFVINLVWS